MFCGLNGRCGWCCCGLSGEGGINRASEKWLEGGVLFMLLHGVAKRK